MINSLKEPQFLFLDSCCSPDVGAHPLLHLHVNIQHSNQILCFTKWHPAVQRASRSCQSESICNHKSASIVSPVILWPVNDSVFSFHRKKNQQMFLTPAKHGCDVQRYGCAATTDFKFWRSYTWRERFKCSMCVSESFVRLVCGVRVCTLAECLRCRSGVDYLLREVLLLRHSSFHPSRSNLCFSSTIMSAVMTSPSQCESVFRPIPHSLGARCSWSIMTVYFLKTYVYFLNKLFCCCPFRNFRTGTISNCGKLLSIIKKKINVTSCCGPPICLLV